MGGKLWHGRFREATNQLVESFTASIRFDQRLYRYDIEGSMAHCRMLAHQGLLSAEEADTLIQGLSEILREIEHGSFVFDDTQEDVHMAIEQRLMEKVGEVGGKLHAGRSRNDQVALDMRLFLRDEVKGTEEDLKDLQSNLVAQAKANLGVIMAGFTHLQHAQPVLFSHHLAAVHLPELLFPSTVIPLLNCSISRHSAVTVSMPSVIGISLLNSPLPPPSS
jgi:argininosuccinate lyase